jgi:hypothetical protein
MKRLLVRIRKDNQSDPELFEVSGDQRVADLVANLVKALNLPLRDRNNLPCEYWLATANGDLIRDDDTLNGIGIGNKALLFIQTGAVRPAELSAASVGTTSVAPLGAVSSQDKSANVARSDTPWAKGFRPIAPARPRTGDVEAEPPPGWKKLDRS